jgi:Spy/CpxP family protein refolding chaperone
MKLKLVGITGTAALAVAMLAYAQPPGRGAGKDKGGPPTDAVKTYLTLTDSQITGFQAIRQTAQTAAEPIFEQMQTKQQALRTAMNATPVNAATITSLQAEITALRAQLDRIQAGAQAQMAALLSAAQKTKLATLEAAAALRQEVQGAAAIGLVEGGGPGGPGGRGPGGPGGRGKGGRPNF